MLSFLSLNKWNDSLNRAFTYFLNPQFVGAPEKHILNTSVNRANTLVNVIIFKKKIIHHFYVLVYFGFSCIVWYNSVPGFWDTLPVGLDLSFVNCFDMDNVIPGYRKIHFIETETTEIDLSSFLTSVYDNELRDISIPSSQDLSQPIGLAVWLSILLSFSIGPLVGSMLDAGPLIR